MSGEFRMTIKLPGPTSEQERAYWLRLVAERQQLVDETCEPDVFKPRLTDTQADHNIATAEGWGNQTMPHRQEFSGGGK